MGEPDLQIHVDESARGCLVRVAGQLGMFECDRFQAALTRLSARRPPLVVFDLSRVPLISSICMGALLSFQKGMRLNGGVCRLAELTPQVLGSLKHARLTDVLPVFPSVEDALGPVAG